MESGEACAGCPWNEEPQELIIYKLMNFLHLLNSGCPLGRHELRNEEWRALGIVKNELERLAAEDAKAKAK